MMMTVSSGLFNIFSVARSGGGFCFCSFILLAGTLRCSALSKNPFERKFQEFLRSDRSLFTQQQSFGNTSGERNLFRNDLIS